MLQPCPKCGYSRETTDAEPDWQCPRCGIAYAKYQARLDQAVPTPPLSPKPGGRSKRSFNEVLVICAGITSVMLLLRGMHGSITLLHAGLLVPFFICLVPAISSTFGDGLYYWNKWTASFDRFDDEAHPIMFRLQQIFSFVFAVIFAGFFFMLKR